MKEKETYSALIRRLKEKDPHFSDKLEIRKRIMRQVNTSSEDRNRITRILYQWTELPWLRWSLSTAAAILLTLFLSQQIMISHRLKNLEKQFVKTDASVEINEPSTTPSGRFVFKLISERKLDSITVSRDDLDALLEEYLNLKKEIMMLKGDTENSGDNQ